MASSEREREFTSAKNRWNTAIFTTFWNSGLGLASFLAFTVSASAPASKKSSWLHHCLYPTFTDDGQIWHTRVNAKICQCMMSPLHGEKPLKYRHFNGILNVVVFVLMSLCRSEPNLMCQSEPMVYFCTPNFTLIGVSCRLCAAQKPQIWLFWNYRGLLYPPFLSSPKRPNLAHENGLKV